MSAVNSSWRRYSMQWGLIRPAAQDQWDHPESRQSDNPIPLQSVQVEASVVHAVAQVQITQVFVNKEEEPIEAIYYFPVDPSGAVTHFEAELEGRKIKVVVKPNEDAKDEYEKAIQQGHTAVLGGENKADIFKVRIGYLKPGSSAKIIIGYVTEVKNERDSNAIRFYIPTTVAPRYVPMETTDEEAEDLRNMQFSDASPAPMTIKTHVSIQGDIKSIESPTHKIVVSSQGPVEGKAGWTKATVELNGTTTDMDRDFVLLITPAEPHKPRLYIEKLYESLAMMAHLIPSFKLKEQKAELIFVLDRSGSMGGSSIKLAKEALTLFLHSLPSDCYFNIVGFGSNYEILFPQSVKYDDESLKLAKQHTSDLDANMGGTEILAPLRQIYCTEPIPGYLRQIFVITDGEVSNADQVIGLVKAKSHQSRLFALGIGDGASHHLVEGIAKAGGGNSAFVTYNESVKDKVLQQLKDALQPSLTVIRINWHGVNDDLTDNQPTTPSPVAVNTEKTLLGYGKPVEGTQDTGSASIPARKSYWQAPENVPPIFDGSQLLVFAIFEHPQETQPTGCTITADSPDGPLYVDIQLSEENDVGATGMLHKLAAVKIVREMELKVAALEYDQQRDSARRVLENPEEAQVYKEKITELAVREGIASNFTSFVAVDTSSFSSTDDGDDNALEDCWVMQTRVVPSQLTHGWHGYSSGASVAPVVAPAYSDSYSPSSSYPSWSCDYLFCHRSRGGGSKRYGSSFASRDYRQSGGSSRTSYSSYSSSSYNYSYSYGFSSYPNIGYGGSYYVPTDKLDAIVSLQSFIGAFKWEESLLKTLGLDMTKAQTEAEQNGWDLDAWATALALAYFNSKLGYSKMSWELVINKAQDWLSKNHGSVETAMMVAAESLIRNLNSTDWWDH